MLKFLGAFCLGIFAVCIEFIVVSPVKSTGRTITKMSLIASRPKLTYSELLTKTKSKVLYNPKKIVFF